jgi:hypothetical protein
MGVDGVHGKSCAASTVARILDRLPARVRLRMGGGGALRTAGSARTPTVVIIRAGFHAGSGAARAAAATIERLLPERSPPQPPHGCRAGAARSLSLQSTFVDSASTALAATETTLCRAPIRPSSHAAPPGAAAHRHGLSSPTHPEKTQ